MSFKKLNMLVLTFFFYLPLFSQKEMTKEIEFFSQKMIHPDSVLAKFQKENDLVIGYATYNEAWGIPPSYRIIARKNNKWKAYEYITKPYAKVLIDSNGKQTVEPFIFVNSFDITSGFIDSFLIVFKQQKIWKLKCDKTRDFLFIHCTHLLKMKYDPCSISDGMSVGSLIMTKKYINASSFYAPEYYEYECCPGNLDRKRFLATISPIEQLFKKISQKE